jgi:hypothetical protein
MRNRKMRGTYEQECQCRIQVLSVLLHRFTGSAGVHVPVCTVGLTSSDEQVAFVAHSKYERYGGVTEVHQSQSTRHNSATV